MKPFDINKPMIGMVHLLPTPLSPERQLEGDGMKDGTDGTGSGLWDLEEVVEMAIEDAGILFDNGADGIMIENYHDTPFYPEEVPSHTVATMGVVVREVVKEYRMPVGVNILRNACAQALGVAAVAGADFIRCNVLSGTMLTTEGSITGKAHELIRYRDTLALETGRKPLIFADIFVKHAYSLVPISQFEDLALDTFRRGGADALIISGTRTGTPPDQSLLAQVRSLRERAPEIKLIAGSGISPDNVIYVRKVFDAFIVGTYTQEYDEGRKRRIVVPERVRAMKAAIQGK